MVFQFETFVAALLPMIDVLVAIASHVRTRNSMGERRRSSAFM